MENIISVRNLTKIYKLYNNKIDRVKEALDFKRRIFHHDFYALKDVTFDVKRGETLGIIGKNGSGKSTLLKIITGVLNQSTGDMYVGGRVSALLELGAGFNPEYTGIENVFLNGTMMGISRSDMESKLEDIISFADIGEHIYQPVKTYSSGMFVRLAFAVAINVDPDILIVDEALAVGDVRFQMKCLDKFNEFKSKGVTVLFVSHDINSVKKFCDRALWLNHGEVLEIGDVNDISDKYLDQLKVEDLDNGNALITDSSNMEENQEYSSQPQIGKLIAVSIVDEFDNEVHAVSHDVKIRIRIEYDIYDDSIDGVALGVAIKRVDHLYICGLNTVLDQVEVEWSKGRNYFTLEYDHLNLIGGEYYLDVALFDKNAYIPIDYRVKYKEFIVKSEYVGEGLVILNHKWSS